MFPLQKESRPAEGALGLGRELLPVKGAVSQGQSWLTWASVRPSIAASCFRSGLVTYF